MRLMMLPLLVLMTASCAAAPKPPVIQPAPPPPKLASENFSCPAWPVVAFLDALTAQDKLAVAHGQAEPAHADCACRLYSTAVALERLSMLNGPLPERPYGCDI